MSVEEAKVEQEQAAENRTSTHRVARERMGRDLASELRDRGVQPLDLGGEAVDVVLPLRLGGS